MNLRKARIHARRAVERLYEGRASIYTYEHIKRTTGENTTVKRAVASGVPCRLSFDTSPSASSGDVADGITQGITLFLSPSVEVKEGSFIEVTQEGKTMEYQNSGVPKVYATHQEIKLSLVKEWA